MQLLTNKNPGQRGYILLGVLTLAVIIAVAVSMALLSSQQKVDETRGKEANIEARLAMDSTASRIITRMDLALENQGTYLSDDAGSISFGGISSGSYNISSVSPDVGIGLDPYSLYRNHLYIHPQDPLLRDVRMNTTNFNVAITTSTAAVGYSNYLGTYTFQIRAVPVSDFAVFNPGMQTETIQLGSGIDRVTDDAGYVQTNVPVYVGELSPGTNGGSFLSGLTTDIINTEHAGLASRFFRTVASSNPGAANVQGSPKWDNAASIGFGTMVGEFENSMDYGSYASMASELTTFGSLHTSDSGTMATIDPDTYYFDLASHFNVQVYTNYTLIQVTNSNPLYTPENGGYVAVLDLGAALSAAYTGISSGPKEKTLFMGLPTLGGNVLTTIVVTNSETLPGNMNVSFPPSELVLLADHVNINTPQRLRIEGNIGFLPYGIDVLGITNSVLNQRNYPGVYSYQETQPYINQTNIPVNLPAGTNVNSYYVYSPGAQALYDKLYTWAQDQQEKLLSTPNTTDLPGTIAGPFTAANPYYNQNAADLDWLYHNLAIFPLANNGTVTFQGSPLIPSGNPITTLLTGTITNMTELVKTNDTYQYSFAGFTTASQCDQGGGYYVLNTNMLDTYMPSNVTIISPQVADLIDSAVSYGTNYIVQSFLSVPPPAGPLLYALHSTISSPPTDPAIDNAGVGIWQPYNLTAAQLLASINDTNNISLSVTFAIAWIEVVTNNFDASAQSYYYETYLEQNHLMQDSGNSEAFQTNAPTFSDFPTNAVNPITGESWYTYLDNQWLASLATLAPIDPPAPTFRYLDNAYNTGSGNQGAWRRTDEILSTESYNTNGETDLGIGDLGTNYMADFTQRQVIFHYMTIGWAITNSAITLGMAPSFNGRMVSSDGIKEILGLVPTNVVINGQITYTYRLHSLVNDNTAIVPAYTVNHDQHMYPLDCAERLYDIRIFNTDTRRH